MAKKRLPGYEEAQSEILEVLEKIKCSSDELRKLVEKRLEVEPDSCEKEASK